MAYKYNLIDLLKGSFGISDVKYYNTNVKSKDSVISYNGIDTIDLNSDYNPEALNSMLGTPIVMPIRLGDNEIHDRQKYGAHVKWQSIENGEIKTFRTGAVTLPPATIISLKRRKNIVKTQIFGNNGEVNEFMGFSSWQIDIKGFIVNEKEPNNYPEDYVHSLNSLFNAPVSLAIDNKICEILEIYEIVIEDFDLAPIEGAPGVQAFSMSCTSDKPYELIKKQNNS